MGLLTGGCSLKIGPPLVTVAVRSDLAAATRPARSPALSDLSCFAVIVGGGPNPVTASQTGTRSPACLKVNGTFFGPYTYDEITSGQGVQVTVPAGGYTFSLVGFYRAAGGCGGSLSSIYSGTPAETYSVAAPQSVDLSASTTLSLAPAAYSLSATDLTGACPPEAFSCSGTVACDTFTDSDLTLVSGHSMDVGGGWTVDNAINPIISSNRLLIGAFSAGVNAQFRTLVGGTDVRIRGKVTLGASGGGGSGLIGRRSSSNDYVFARVVRSGVSVCNFELGYVAFGGTNMINQTSLPYSECVDGQAYSLVLNTVGFTATAIYEGHTLQGDYAPVLTGSEAGFYSFYSGIQSAAPTADDFSITSLARAPFDLHGRQLFRPQ